MGTAGATVAESAEAAPSAPPLWLRLAPVVFLLLWATGFPIGKIGLRSAGPMTFLALRYALVVLALLPLVPLLRPAWPRGAQWRHLLVVGALIQGIYFGLGYAAIALGVSAGVAALIVSLQPILTALLAPRLAGEAVSGRAWAGMALGLAGAALVVAAGQGLQSAAGLGELAAVGALLAITAGTFYEKRHGGQVHPVPANLVQHGAALAVFAPLAWSTEQFRVDWTPTLAGALAYLVIGNSLVAVTLLLAMVRRGAVSRVSALFFLVPPMAAAIAWLMLGETMPPLAWLGFVLAAAGVALVAGGGLPAAVRAAITSRWGAGRG